MSGRSMGHGAPLKAQGHNGRRGEGEMYYVLYAMGDVGKPLTSHISTLTSTSTLTSASTFLPLCPFVPPFVPFVVKKESSTSTSTFSSG